MSRNKISYSWYKVNKDLKVISQSEQNDFDHSINDLSILWIEKSGPHGYYPSPEIYDDPIYHYRLFDTNKQAIDIFHIKNGWSFAGMSTILEFRESYYAQCHIEDPLGMLRNYKLFSTTSLAISKKLRFIRDELASFDSWEVYDTHKK